MERLTDIARAAGLYTKEKPSKKLFLETKATFETHLKFYSIFIVLGPMYSTHVYLNSIYPTFVYERVFLFPNYEISKNKLHSIDVETAEVETH